MNNEDDLSFFKVPEIEFDNYPNIWYKFFDRSDSTPESNFRSLITKSIQSHLRGRDKLGVNSFLRYDPEKFLRYVIQQKLKSRFPIQEAKNLIIQETIRREEYSSSKFKNPESYKSGVYRGLQKRVKMLENRYDEFLSLHAENKSKLRSPDTFEQIFEALYGKDPDSLVARTADLLILGFWFYKIDNILIEVTGAHIENVVSNFFEETFGKNLPDQKENIVASEGIRGISMLLRLIGGYYQRFMNSAMVCHYKKNIRGSRPIDEPLMILFPNIYLLDWLSFSTKDNLGNFTKSIIDKVFPLTEISSERRSIVGAATQKNVRYRYLALEIVGLMNLQKINNRPPHHEGLYINRILYFLNPFLIHFSNVE